MITDERGLELAVLREDLQESILSRHHLLAAKRRIVKRNRALRQRVRDLEDHLASLESHMSELEEETAELHKENEAVLGRDDDHQEAYDEEPMSTDDGHGSDNGDDAMLSWTSTRPRPLVRRTPRRLSPMSASTSRYPAHYHPT
jgi:phage shock protein A